ncbi:hypothetical protein [Carboxylicivirga linearis]|uniref:hypothetical protein n=1 Tax=Carboxylicivirga linearis TaxID=1628157 RepID=UPI001BACCC5B|nr:hypothetical protein [Carboxylicivirga linearis]
MGLIKEKYIVGIPISHITPTTFIFSIRLVANTLLIVTPELNIIVGTTIMKIEKRSVPEIDGKIFILITVWLVDFKNLPIIRGLKESYWLCLISRIIKIDCFNLALNRFGFSNLFFNLSSVLDLIQLSISTTDNLVEYDLLIII